MSELSRHTQLEEDLMGVLEDYLETRLFRDTNDPTVNELFWEMYGRLADTAMFYVRSGGPNGFKVIS